MGILGASLLWISNKSLFLLVGGLVAICFLWITYKELKGERKRMLLPHSPTGAFGSYGYLARVNTAVKAMDALEEDTDPAAQRRNIIQIIANNSTDNQQTQSNIDQLTRQIASEQQEGGPLNELIKERIQGRINPQDYRLKLMEHIRVKAHENGIPLREEKLISTIPFNMRQIGLGSQNIDFQDKLKFLEQQGKAFPQSVTNFQGTPPPPFPSITFPTLPSNVPPDQAAAIQQRWQDVIAQARQRYNAAFGLG